MDVEEEISEKEIGEICVNMYLIFHYCTISFVWMGIWENLAGSGIWEFISSHTLIDIMSLYFLGGVIARGQWREEE